MSGVQTGTEQAAGTEQVSGSAQETTAGADKGNQAASASTQAQASESLGWRAALSKELREHDVVKGHKTVGDFARAALADREKLQRAIVRPGDNATDDEIAAYREAMGMPKSIEEFDLQGEGMSPERTQAFKEIAWELGLSKEQTKKLFDWDMDVIGRAVEAHKANMEKSAKEAIKVLAEEYGDKLEAKKELSNRAIRTYGGEKVLEALKDAGLDMNPEIIRMFVKVGEATANDLMPSETGAPVKSEKNPFGYIT